jgi:hypothetical protein
VHILQNKKIMLLCRFFFHKAQNNIVAHLKVGRSGSYFKFAAMESETGVVVNGVRGFIANSSISPDFALTSLVDFSCKQFVDDLISSP